MLANQKVERRSRAHLHESAEGGGGAWWRHAVRGALDWGVELLVVLTGGVLALLRNGWGSFGRSEDDDAPLSAPGVDESREFEAGEGAGDLHLASLAHTLASHSWEEEEWQEEKTQRMEERDDPLDEEAYRDQAASLRGLFTPADEGKTPAEAPLRERRP